VYLKMADNNETKSSSDGKKPKGSYPPRLTLAEAGIIVTDLYERAGSEATLDELSEILGNTMKSSAFSAKLVCLRKFGLIDSIGNKVKLSDTANSIVAPEGRSERAQALKTAFLMIDEYAKVYSKIEGKILPEDKFLQNSFLEYGGKDLAPKWMESFKESIDYAGLVFDRGDGKYQVRSMGSGTGPTKEITVNDTAAAAESMSFEPAVARLSETEKTPYQFLIDIWKADMTEDEQQAVWTLLQYLKKQEARPTRTPDEG
jgi:hypothetical protein